MMTINNRIIHQHSSAPEPKCIRQIYQTYFSQGGGGEGGVVSRGPDPSYTAATTSGAGRKGGEREEEGSGDSE